MLTYVFHGEYLPRHPSNLSRFYFKCLFAIYSCYRHYESELEDGQVGGLILVSLDGPQPISQ